MRSVSNRYCLEEKTRGFVNVRDVNSSERLSTEAERVKLMSLTLTAMFIVTRRASARQHGESVQVSAQGRQLCETGL
jgi:hypothetical protein